MRCQVCGRADKTEGEPCDYCGATVRSIHGRGMPLSPRAYAEIRGERARRAAERARRRREKLIWHSVAAAIILFVIGALGNTAFYFFTPGMILYGILRSAAVAVILGPPIGLIISWRNYGPKGGGTVGGLCFALGVCIAGGANIWMILIAAIPGIFVGWLTAIHVGIDWD